MLSRDAFLSIGVTIACVKRDGKTPVLRNKLTNFVKYGRNKSTYFFKTLEVMQSEKQDLAEKLIITFLISSAVQSLNPENFRSSPSLREKVLSSYEPY